MAWARLSPVNSHLVRIHIHWIIIVFGSLRALSQGQARLGLSAVELENIGPSKKGICIAIYWQPGVTSCRAKLPVQIA